MKQLASVVTHAAHSKRLKILKYWTSRLGGSHSDLRLPKKARRTSAWNSPGNTCGTWGKNTCLLSRKTSNLMVDDLDDHCSHQDGHWCIYIYILYCDLPHQLAGWKHIEIYGRSKADVSQVQGFLGLVTICLVVFRLKNMRKVSDDEWWTIYHSQDFWIKECSKPPSSCTWWVNKLTTSKPRENPLVIELRGTPQIVIILET